MQTYIFELDIIGFTPGSAFGLAAVYSAWVWRSLGASAGGVALGLRLVAMSMWLDFNQRGTVPQARIVR